MKKTITIILLCLSINLIGQNNGKLKHIAAGSLIGFTSYQLSYTLLTNNSNINPFWAKVITQTFSMFVTSYAGYAWEKYSNGVYNNEDIRNTIKGGLFAVGFNFTIDWNRT